MRQYTNSTYKKWIDIKDDAQKIYNFDSQIKFKTTMLYQVYVITVTHKYLLKEVYKSQTLHSQMLMQIRKCKNNI